MAEVGVVTITEKTFSVVKKITWNWTSDAAGAASGFVTTGLFDGKCIALFTDPAAQCPSDNYDIVVLDSDGTDVLANGGQNRDTANSEVVAEASLGAVAASTLELQISNAGGFKQGIIYLYIR